MVTRKDVANMAGVSVTIVSRALNNSGYVAKEKKEAVLKAAEELGYRPNPIALSLQTKRTKQILFFNKDLSNAFTTELYRGMVQYANQFDYMIVLSGTLDLNKLKTMMIDGIILQNETIATEYAKQMGSYNSIPTVSASYGTPEKNPRHIPFVESDTYVATEMLIQYLRDKGHEKIALATPYKLYITQPRHVAYVSLMRPVLGDQMENYVFNRCKTDEGVWIEENFCEEGEQIAQAFLERKSDATAIICFNDDFAMGMCKHFNKMGVRIPEDISIVGIDGIGISKYMTPTLTTVNISPQQQGAECVRTLLDMIDGKKVKNRVEIPIKLVEGESVKDLTR